jgi:hypothetical protein
MQEEAIHLPATQFQYMDVYRCYTRQQATPVISPFLSVKSNQNYETNTSDIQFSVHIQSHTTLVQQIRRLSSVLSM